MHFYVAALHCCSTQTGFTFILLMRQNVQIYSKFYFKKNHVTIWRCPISPQYKNSQFFLIFRQAKNGGIKNCINLIRNKKEKKWHLATKLFFIIATKRRKLASRNPLPATWCLILTRCACFVFLNRCCLLDQSSCCFGFFPDQ